jgi:hypothetical protein
MELYTKNPSFQKSAQQREALHLEPSFRRLSWIPNRSFRCASQAFGKTNFVKASTFKQVG